MTPDSPTNDNIWRGSPTSNESAASWRTAFQSLSLHTGLREESTPSGHLPLEPQRSPSLSEWTTVWQGSFEQPPRPPTRRSKEDGHTQPQNTAPAPNPFLGQRSDESGNTQFQRLSPATHHFLVQNLQNLQPGNMTMPRNPQPPPSATDPFLRQNSQPGNTRMPQNRQPPPSATNPFLRQNLQPGNTRMPRNPQPPRSAPNPFLRQTSQPTNARALGPHPSRTPPRPPNYVAAFVAVFESRPRDNDPCNFTRPKRRNSSIIIESRPGANQFREFCCIPTPHRLPKRQVQFYSSPDIPDPRYGSPGLINMRFIAWLPCGEVAVLDNIMRSWRRLVEPSWDHRTWIELYLIHLVERRLITRGHVAEMMTFQRETLQVPFTDDLPNFRQCFPQLQ